MAKELEALVAKSRRCKRPKDQISCAYGLADLSTHREYAAAASLAPNPRAVA